jgi:imidazolonepropionase
MQARLRILNAAQLVCVERGTAESVASASAKDANRRWVRCGAEQQNRVDVVEDGGLVVGMDGRIVLCGPSADVAAASRGWTFEPGCDIDARGKCVLPGFVDAHTHPVWAGDRSHEFHLKLAGATYMDIAAMGGGINFTTECTRAAPEAELLALLEARLRRMARFGTTTVEGKSGYGLNTETELKMLRVLATANRRQQQQNNSNNDNNNPATTSQQPSSSIPAYPRIISNFCGAHSVPRGVTAELATRTVVDEMLPAVAKAKAAGEIDATLCDVFCEKGVFDVAQTREILDAARAVAGLDANFHGDELNPLRACELGGEMGALAVSHCEHVSPEGVAKMAVRPTAAVLLPTTAYVLRITPPPARDLIRGGVPVALGSDFCPNAHCMSMPHVMNLACVTLKMTVNEALVASTLNAAYSLGVAHEVGSLEVGKWGDVVVLDAPKWEHVVYQMVDPPIEAVFRAGCKIAGSIHA